MHCAHDSLQSCIFEWHFNSFSWEGWWNVKWLKRLFRLFVCFGCVYCSGKWLKTGKWTPVRCSHGSEETKGQCKHRRLLCECMVTWMDSWFLYTTGDCFHILSIQQAVTLITCHCNLFVREFAQKGLMTFSRHIHEWTITAHNSFIRPTYWYL